jgi:hypothetical protein
MDLDDAEKFALHLFDLVTRRKVKDVALTREKEETTIESEQTELEDGK